MTSPFVLIVESRPGSKLLSHNLGQLDECVEAENEAKQSLLSLMLASKEDGKL